MLALFFLFFSEVLFSSNFLNFSQLFLINFSIFQLSILSSNLSNEYLKNISEHTHVFIAFFFSSLNNPFVSWIIIMSSFIFLSTLINYLNFFFIPELFLFSLRSFLLTLFVHFGLPFQLAHSSN